MKIALLNGSPNKNGCTFTALSECAGAIEELGGETEIIQLGTKPVRGCIDCGRCGEKKDRKCVFDDDVCNEISDRLFAADGIIIGSPVYYASANGTLCAVLDRIFYSSYGAFAGKPAAAVVSCRRGGASAAFDRLNKYFTINQMPVVSSTYWNSVHGSCAEDVKKDLEGLQVMRALGRNMVYLIESIKRAGLTPPEQERKVFTNFMDGK
jgi:multimeric flavodoxin WrbA